MKNFFVFSLPRSRSAWLSVFLSQGNSFCYHEALTHIKSFSELKQLFYRSEAKVVGNSDPTNIVFADEILTHFPDAKILIVDRPVTEVWESLKRVGLEFDLDFLKARYGELHEMANNNENALLVGFEQLESVDVMAAVWEHLMQDEEPFDLHRFYELNRLNIQVHDMEDALKEARPNIAALLKERELTFKEVSK